MQTSVHIKPVHAGALEHNERTRKLDHVRDDLSKFNENWHASGYSSNDELLAEIKEDYKAEHGKKLHAKATPVREGVVVIREDTTMAQLLSAARRCEEEFGIQLQAVSIHRDEGHYEKGPNPMTPGPWIGNYHAHLTWCWYDWHTHTTCKLNRDDTAAMQTIFAQELAMERGIPSTKKGLSAIQFKVQKKQEQLAALEQQGKLATAQAAKLQADIAALQEKEAAAIEKLQAAEKAASREQLRSNLADAGARVLNVFGRGAVAEAHADRDEALERAEAAEKEAAADRKAREAAEKAAKNAQDARKAAEAARSRAETEKAEYGRERYEAGQAEGFKAGRQSVADSIAPLQQQLAAKQATIDNLQRTRDERLDKATAEVRARAEAAEKELADMKSWNSNMLDWQQSVQDMKTAGLSDEDIKSVFRNGSAIVQVSIKHNYKTYPVETVAKIGYKKTAANATKHGVWFRFEESWYSVKNFLSKALDHIRQLHPSKGLGLH